VESLLALRSLAVSWPTLLPSSTIAGPCFRLMRAVLAAIGAGRIETFESPTEALDAMAKTVPDIVIAAASMHPLALGSRHDHERPRLARPGREDAPGRGPSGARAADLR
jgi:hypothetical protein